MRVIVPSIGRAGTAPAAAWLSKLKHEVVFAVHRDEMLTYAESYPWAEIVLLPESTRGHVGRVRRHLLRVLEEPFCFVDDDASVRLVNFRTHDEMIDQLQRHLDVEDVCMAGIGKQIFSNGVIPSCGQIGRDKLAIRNKFCSVVYAVKPWPLRDCPLEKFRVYEDCALIIHAIRATGNVVSYGATHTNKTPPHGGCNSWRTPAIIRESMMALAREYPDVVSVGPTRHTAHNADLGVGVRVSWSRIRA